MAFGSTGVYVYVWRSYTLTHKLTEAALALAVTTLPASCHQEPTCRASCFLTARRALPAF